MATAAARGNLGRWPAERRFYTGIAIAMALVAYIGFARSFYLHPFFPDYPTPSESIFVVHGIFFSAWCVLLVTQAALIGVRRADLHRRLGLLGAVIAAGMLVLGVYGALVAASRPTGFVLIPVPPLQFLVIPIFDMVLFATFVALALKWRADAQAHKRLMVLATVSLLAAAFARWPFVRPIGNPFLFFGLADLFIVALAVWDFRSRGSLHPVTRWGGLIMILSQPLRLMLSATPAWLAFAGWLTALAR